MVRTLLRNFNSKYKEDLRIFAATTYRKDSMPWENFSFYINKLNSDYKISKKFIIRDLNKVIDESINS